MKLTYLPLKHFKQSNTDFRYRTYLKDETLAQTIVKTGICDPLYITTKNNHPMIIDGFKRIHALSKHFPSSFSVPVIHIAEKDFTWRTHLALILKQDARGTLPFIEKVSAYLMLRNMHSHADASEIMQALNLPDRPDYHKIYLCMKNLPQKWACFFTDHAVPGRRIKAICEAVDLQACTSLLNVNFGLNRLEQTVIMLSEIEKREGVSTGKILRTILDEFKEDQIRPESLFLRIRERRYPLRSRYEKKIENSLKALHSPRFVTVQSDKNGERPGAEISATIRNEQEADEFLFWYKKTKESLKKLLKERLEL